MKDAKDPSLTEVPVLIVGAGPVGLMASLLLGRLGVENVVVDRRSGPHRAPQAHVINGRSLEICRSAGMDIEQLRAAATPLADGSEVSWVTTLLGDELVRQPYERQGDENLRLTPTPLINLSQHLFEPIVLDHVNAQPESQVAHNQQWLSLDQDPSGVTSCVKDLNSGTERRIRSRYLLAADGAASRVRSGLGIEMLGPDQLQSFIMIHFGANLRDYVRDRPAILYWVLDPRHAGSFIAHDIDSTWVFMHPYDSASKTVDSFTPDRCASIVQGAIGAAAAGRVPPKIEIQTISSWTMTAQIAERYSQQRVFLIGDSAHRFPPAGGMGMNTGIQDAHNLVWKLALRERNLAGAELLQTYEAERRPVAERNAEVSLNNALGIFEVLTALEVDDNSTASADRMTQVLRDANGRARVLEAIDKQREHFDMIGLQLGFSYEAGAIKPDGTAAPKGAGEISHFEPTSRPGARLPHAWIEIAGRRASSLDLVAEDFFTLILSARFADGPRVESIEAQLGARGLPVTCRTPERDFVDPAGNWARVAEIGDHGALLVRPDQHVAARWMKAPENLADEVEQLLGTLLS